MGWLDKLLGRGKRTMGEAADSPRMREEGRHQEAAGQASERAEGFQERAAAEQERAATERSEQDRLS
jgi:uncharacterized protein YjbJ (UPF0337 family)